MTTRRAYASMTATSSAVAERTVCRRRPAAAAAAVAWTLPNAPKRTFAIERFIARAIIIVSSVPDAPTSMPLTISTFECRTNPVAAAARPVNAFSSEITTGMSAPPIGSTNSDAEDERADDDRRSEEPEARPTTIAAAPSATSAAKQRQVPDLLARIRDRPPADQLLQLRERDQRAGERDEPISAERTIATAALDADVAGRRPDRVVELASATSAAAPPPTPLNSATICGIAVIFTARAPYDPDRGADRHPDQRSTSSCVTTWRRENVTTIANSHPDRADPVAEPRAPRRREEPQREDEADDRDQVEQVRSRSGSPLAASSARFFFGLNISSIRSVTTKPPTTFAGRQHDRDERRRSA